MLSVRNMMAVHRQATRSNRRNGRPSPSESYVNNQTDVDLCEPQSSHFHHPLGVIGQSVFSLPARRSSFVLLSSLTSCAWMSTPGHHPLPPPSHVHFSAFLAELMTPRRPPKCCLVMKFRTWNRWNLMARFLRNSPN